MHIQLVNLSKEYQRNHLLSDMTLTFSDTDRVGIIGKNGSGKTTLLNIFSGKDSDYTGQIVIDPKNATIGYLTQEFSLKGETVWDCVSSFDTDLAIAALVQFWLHEYANIRITSLSEGQKTALAFVLLSLQNPDIVLLDEPTNHLDKEMLGIVEQWIRKRTGITILVSHNRSFLDKTVTSIIELKNGKARIFGGNYSFYKQHIESELEKKQQDYERYQKEMKKKKEEIRLKKERSHKLNEDKKYKRDNSHAAPAFFANRASKKAASVAKSVERNLQRLKKQEKPEYIKSTKIHFPKTNRSGETVLIAKNLMKIYGGRNLFEDLSFSIQYKDRVSLEGPNGSGKSTLLKILLNTLQPDKGTISYGNAIKIGYLSQERKEVDFEKTVREELSNLTEEEIHRSFATFLLPQGYLTKKCGNLSSGERAKVILIKLLFSDTNFLILDEPTNHLDISSIEGMEEALKEYQGTLLVVSHDEYFKEKIEITRRIEL